MKQAMFFIFFGIQGLGMMFSTFGSDLKTGCVYTNVAQVTNLGYILVCELARDRFLYDPARARKDICNQENEDIRNSLLEAGLRLNKLERECKLYR